MPSEIPAASVFQISVKELVGFCCRRGDLILGFSRTPTGTEGIRGHQQVQRQRPEDYHAEVTVRHEMVRENIILKLSGRMDGVFTAHDPVCIEEIKTTHYPARALPESIRTLHLAQAKIYAYLYCLKNPLELPQSEAAPAQCQIQMTYFHLEAHKEENFVETFSLETLRHFFESLTSHYLHWLEKLVTYRQQRNRSIQKLAFPHGEFRRGQRELAVKVYRAVANQQQLLAQAPTGIGKTISTLFPAVKALGEDAHDFIFYLTAKTSGRLLAENALQSMAAQGLVLKSLTLTAKEKFCFCQTEPATTPPESGCVYAQGYYDRLPQALEELFHQHHFSRNTVEQLAKKHRLCPFELSLDFSLWVDVVIGDYNHVFHPSSALKRLQEEKKRRKTLLIDEAHNLVDRTREMFTVSLHQQSVQVLHQAVRGVHQPLAQALQPINAHFLALQTACETNEGGLLKKGDSCFVQEEKPPLDAVLRRFCEAFEQWLLEEESLLLEQALAEGLVDFYFQVRQFLKIYELYNERFITLIKIATQGGSKWSKNIEMVLYCLDASEQLQAIFASVHSSVLFSATFTPFSYYARVLGLGAAPQMLELPSPFPPQNLGVFVTSYIKTTYHQRAHSFEAIADLILDGTAPRAGKYLVCFPSYDYLQRVQEKLCQKHPNAPILAQTPEMDEAARRAFLNQFTAPNTPETTLLGFIIMGGLFGEGIDLPGTQLIGTIVIGVGLPQVGVERELMKEYYDHAQWPGFAFAYQFPGMNRVLQTAGRVIRSPTDCGIVVLVDERFAQGRYGRLFPAHWHCTPVRHAHQLQPCIEAFWQKHPVLK